MPLLIEDRLRELGVKRPEKAAPLPLGFLISRDLLSKPYGLAEGTVLVGRLEELYELVAGLPMADEALKELWGTEVKFVLRPLMSGDYLFLHEDSWRLLRDYGAVVPERFVFKVVILRAIKDGEEVEIYPRRIVRAWR